MTDLVKTAFYGSCKIAHDTLIQKLMIMDLAKKLIIREVVKNDEEFGTSLTPIEMNGIRQLIGNEIIFFSSKICCKEGNPFPLSSCDDWLECVAA